MKFVSLFLFLFVFTNSALAAQCLLTEGQTAQVKRVIDGDTVELTTGQHVRLVGIQAPKLPLGRKNFKAWPLAPDAKKALEKMVGGKAITLKYGGRQKDRHGRMLAHIFIGGLWVQKEMIKNGFARVYSFPDNRACVGNLLRVEEQARFQKKAIWKRPFYRIRNAENIEKLSVLHNTYQLVLGRVLSIGEVKGKIYLNFGKNWKTDFTAIVSRYHQRYFKKSRIKLKELSGKEVRIRGWLGFHNGPKIDLTHPEQIEILTSQ